MKKLSGKKLVAVAATAGAAAGYFILHPYSMLVYYLHSAREAAEGAARDMMDPDMLAMGLPFALFGAAAGLFLGYWLDSERMRAESEKKAAAVNTLHQLMVTLSHYLLNAATVIGGYAGRLSRKEADPAARKELEVIIEEAGSVESVVKTLQSLDSISLESYTEDSETLMIDIKNRLTERLEGPADKAGQRKEAA